MQRGKPAPGEPSQSTNALLLLYMKALRPSADNDLTPTDEQPTPIDNGLIKMQMAAFNAHTVEQTEAQELSIFNQHVSLIERGINLSYPKLQMEIKQLRHLSNKSSLGLPRGPDLTSLLDIILKNSQLKQQEQSELLEMLFGLGYRDYYKQLLTPNLIELVAGNPHLYDLLGNIYTKALKENNFDLLAVCEDGNTVEKVTWKALISQAIFDQKKNSMIEPLFTMVMTHTKSDDNYRRLVYLQLWLESCKNIDQVLAVEGDIKLLIAKTDLNQYSSLIIKMTKQSLLYQCLQQATAGKIVFDRAVGDYLYKHRNSFYRQGIYDAKSKQIYDALLAGNLELAKTMYKEEQRRLNEDELAPLRHSKPALTYSR